MTFPVSVAAAVVVAAVCLVAAHRLGSWRADRYAWPAQVAQLVGLLACCLVGFAALTYAAVIGFQVALIAAPVLFLALLVREPGRRLLSRVRER